MGNERGVLCDTRKGKTLKREVEEFLGMVNDFPF